MAYNLGERFPTLSKTFPLLDPGSYQNTNSLLITPNKVPFLSKSPRNTRTCLKIWTHAIYSGDIKRKILNCTSISSKIPRFTYEKLNKEHVEAPICQCGIKNSCECPIETEKTEHRDEKNCQATVQRRLFKGPPPRSLIGEGHSVLSRKDYGFKILPNGSKIRIFKQIKQHCPPFYDTRIVESNNFYHGCKWSKWTSQRSNKLINNIPGPADYNIERNHFSDDTICAEKLRASRRKTSKQLRFIEKVQRQNNLDALPGPASYTPTISKGTDLKFIGPKAARFILSKYDERPKPTTYFIKRDFDVDKSSFKPCLASLPFPAPFGVKALRFKCRREEGPSPASYDFITKPSQQKHCNLAPFGSNSKRFDDLCGEDSEKNNDRFIEQDTITEHQTYRFNQRPTWVFRSKTIRMKPLVKKNNAPSPADLPLPPSRVKKRLPQFQYNCPFLSSEARFQNWFNWIPVKEKIKSSSYYNLPKRNCLSAVKSGPIYRSERFISLASQTPPPNAYKVENGIENILTTYNQKLNINIENKHKFVWKPLVEQKKLSLDEQENILLNKSIALLDVPDIFEYKKYEDKKCSAPLVKSKTEQSKLLRCFLHAKQVKQYF